jgi:hypothetical protein
MIEATTDAATELPRYRMTLNLNILNHLGIRLYSNSVAVLTETVANAWDADADWVNIEINTAGSHEITITDNGIGMTVDDINRRFLHVGYDRRAESDGGSVTAKGRSVMGRKGLGKLSLFSIAETVDVYTRRAGQPPEAFRMSINAIEAEIGKSESGGTYNPAPLPPGSFGIDADFVGTIIRLSSLKSHRIVSESQLRQRLARRFAIIGGLKGFVVKVNDLPITVMDRGYYGKLQYVWLFGSDDYVNALRSELTKFPQIKRVNVLPGDIVNTPYLINGWIGTSQEPKQLAAPRSQIDSENLNNVILLARGRPIQENILDKINDGRLYTKYLIGELNADFLDDDHRPDIATSSRQSVIEDDERYVLLMSFASSTLRSIATTWTDFRNVDGQQQAVDAIPVLKTWLDSLASPDQRKSAGRLIAKIQSLPIDNPDDRRVLYRQAIMAFERLRLQNNIDLLDSLTEFDSKQFSMIISDVDAIEASMYLDIMKERLKVIDTLMKLTDENALERQVQDHIFDHLWLVEPSWERGTDAQYKEETLGKTFKKATELTQDEEKARLDIRYKRGADSHMIIELKRAERKDLTYATLHDQGRKYHVGLRKGLISEGREDPYIEVVFVLGAAPKSELASDKDLFKQINARYVTYRQLVENAQRVYGEYIKARQTQDPLRVVLASLMTTEPTSSDDGDASSSAS